jgi:tetratricopeptide (TPR) repeat protein
VKTSPILQQEFVMPKLGRKIGRNDPCPCGSGKKYKRCCLEKHEEEARAAAAAAREEEAPSSRSLSAYYADNDEVPDELSNRVIELIQEGKLEEAEETCAELKRRFPDLIDWIERTGMIHEARGETEKAIEYYERCLQYIDDNEELFEEASKDWYRRSIARLRGSLQAPPPEAGMEQGA